MLMCLGAYAKKFQKEEFVSLNEDGKKIGLVISGRVQMIKEDINGEQMLVDITGVNEVFGEIFAATVDNEARVVYQVLEDTLILLIPYYKVLNTCSMDCAFHHRLIENMVRILAEKNVRLMEKIEITSKKTLREKILTYLSIQERISSGRYIEVPMGRTAWALYLNANRSALTRELKKMKDEGIIDYDRNTFLFIRRAEHE